MELAQVIAVWLAALPTATVAAEPAWLLPVDPLFFAEDVCLAPAFAAPGCPPPAQRGDDRPGASAALLAPDLSDPAPLLVVDPSVLREGTEVTY